MPRIILESKEGAHTIECSEGEALLDAILDAGHIYPHGCRAGSCGACRTLIIEGGDDIPAPGIIENITIEGLVKQGNIAIPPGAKLRLACRVNVTKDIKIKAFY
ncbi:MAG: (2Fe-2S)-binding protein [Bacteriovoracaceae bacterium]|nr:(2Fe-2S)-binding protein [Bacteriovoracaceae bacterium]